MIDSTKWQKQIQINNTSMNKSNLHSKANGQQHQVDGASINAIFELQFHGDIFYSRCQDTGEKPDLEKAKMFKECFNKVNTKKYAHILNLNSMRLGVNTIMKLINILESNPFTELNLADNSISEYGMHAVKNIISSTKLQKLNLASNMISEVGLSLILEELIKNTYIKSLDLGIEEGSIRKNSFGIDGARCLAAVLLQNKTLEVLKLEDNDVGINGAEIISIPLKKNKFLKELKISENMIKTQGAQYILLNALNLHSLDIGKNFIKSSIGPTLKKYVETNKNLRKINLEFNEISAEGIQIFFEGVIHSELEEINIRGNNIGDRGLSLIEEIFLKNQVSLSSLRLLDLSSNEITSNGIRSLTSILNNTQVKTLNLSKNLLADEGILELINHLKETSAGEILEKLDFSACKISDKGFMNLLESLSYFGQLKHLKCCDNYISEKYQKIYIELLSKNTTLIALLLHGNRLSLSGIKGLKRVVDKNLKNYQEKQPKKMKSEIYNLKEKQKRIKEAQDKLEKQKKEISKLEETKLQLHENISKLQRQDRDKKSQYDESLSRKSENIQKLIESNGEKLQNLQKMKASKEKSIEELNSELEKLRQKRKQMEYQLAVVQNEGDLIEKEFEKKSKRIK